MTDWEDYSRYRQDDDAFTAEPVQQTRVDTVTRRIRGSVLDVGGGDGYPAAQYQAAGHDVVLVEISPTRVTRATERGVPAVVGDATDLPYADQSWDTVVLGEIVEHLDNPGPALTEAFRIARERVIVTLPLRGWADPTHEWRISLDMCVDRNQLLTDRTRGAQIVLTFQRGKCWPPDYAETDKKWADQFEVLEP